VRSNQVNEFRLLTTRRRFKASRSPTNAFGHTPLNEALQSPRDQFDISWPTRGSVGNQSTLFEENARICRAPKKPRTQSRSTRARASFGFDFGRIYPGGPIGAGPPQAPHRPVAKRATASRCASRKPRARRPVLPARVPPGALPGCNGMRLKQERAGVALQRAPPRRRDTRLFCPAVRRSAVHFLIIFYRLFINKLSVTFAVKSLRRGLSQCAPFSGRRPGNIPAG
jgi:hypothetical protein